MYDLEWLYTSDKALSSEPDWKLRSGGEYLRLVSPLEIDGVSIEGLRFSATANSLMPDMNVAFQIEYFPPKGEPVGGPLSRIEWLPKSPHDNKGAGPVEYRYQKLVKCHIHPFEMNWRHSEAKTNKGILPIAIPIEPGFSTYQDALAFVEKEFRIKGVMGLPLPPWSEKLLW